MPSFFAGVKRGFKCPCGPCDGYLILSHAQAWQLLCFLTLFCMFHVSRPALKYVQYCPIAPRRGFWRTCLCNAHSRRSCQLASIDGAACAEASVTPVNISFQARLKPSVSMASSAQTEVLKFGNWLDQHVLIRGLECCPTRAAHSSTLTVT